MKRYVQIYEYLYNDHTEKSLLGILQEILDWFLEGRNKPQFKKEKKKRKTMVASMNYWTVITT